MEKYKPDFDQGVPSSSASVENAPMRLPALKQFLDSKGLSEMKSWWSCIENMELQVMVKPDPSHEIINRKNSRGGKSKVYKDMNGIEYANFRIPYNANTDPNYKDRPLTWELDKYCQAIGSTGWDWKNKRSMYVGYDFDGIAGHSDKHAATLTPEELAIVRDKASKLDWVEVRKSTGGGGLHFYVKFEDGFPTNTHTEHAAIARALLNKMSKEVNYDFAADIDVCGSVFWLYHTKMEGTEGLKLIKEGKPLKRDEVPANWKDHLEVVKKTRSRVRPNFSTNVDEFDALVNSSNFEKLDEEHMRVLTALRESNHYIDWDPDNHMLITHTEALKKVHKSLNLKGKFETSSSYSSDKNCFAFPIKNGAFSIRRFTKGTAEHASWMQDGTGWTTCYYNKEPDFMTACLTAGGTEDSKGNYNFENAKKAYDALELLGIDTGDMKLPPAMKHERSLLKLDKGSSKICISIEATKDNIEMKGWSREGKYWVRVIYKAVDTKPDFQDNDVDEIVRYVIEGENATKDNLKDYLFKVGYDNNSIRRVVGECMVKPWRKVGIPFGDTYLGDRVWNINAAQFKVKPALEDGHYDMWETILNHIGSELDIFILKDEWCQKAGIKTGGEYLMYWIASLIQFPKEPLPYLFLYGPQKSGKSTLHESISEYLIDNGVIDATEALLSKGGFNGEMAGSVLCYIEEEDLRQNRKAGNKMKEWVTGRKMNIHTKNKTPFMVQNTCHFIQCSNDHNYCPVFEGDTRVTMCHVRLPKDEIPRARLEVSLREQAPYFLRALLALEIPASNSRLRIPIITTAAKEQIQEYSVCPLTNFMTEMCSYEDGEYVFFADFKAKFLDWLDEEDKFKWADKRIKRQLPPDLKRALYTQNKLAIGNLAFRSDIEKHGCKSPENSVFIAVKDKGRNKLVLVDKTTKEPINAKSKRRKKG
jgi:hypothetical protein